MGHYDDIDEHDIYEYNIREEHSKKLTEEHKIRAKIHKQISENGVEKVLEDFLVSYKTKHLRG